jgi:hypothetical protein
MNANEWLNSLRIPQDYPILMCGWPDAERGLSESYWQDYCDELADDCAEEGIPYLPLSYGEWREREIAERGEEDETDEFSWRSQFLTEKTFKAFAFRQVPIWFAVPGLVSQVRDLGFDIFDDIVDHSYDQIQNPDQRRSCVVQTVKDLDNRYSLEQCKQLKEQLQPRFEANGKLLSQLKLQVGTFVQEVITAYQKY